MASPPSKTKTPPKAKSPATAAATDGKHASPNTPAAAAAATASADFLSPVSKYDLERAQAAREQQERMAAVDARLVAQQKARAKRQLEEMEQAENDAASAQKKTRRVGPSLVGKRRRETLDPKVLRRYHERTQQQKQEQQQSGGKPTVRKNSSGSASPGIAMAQTTTSPSPSKRACSRAYRHQYSPSSWRESGTPGSSSKKKQRVTRTDSTSRIDEDEQLDEEPEEEDHDGKGQQPRYLTYETEEPTATSARKTVEAEPLFSRFVDPAIKAGQSDAVKTPPFVKKENAFTTPLAVTVPAESKKSAVNVPDVDIEEDMVDLINAQNVSGMETVEGDDILKMMMRFNTPRVGRKFASESTPVGSEDSEPSYMRQRRLTPVSNEESPVLMKRLLSWDVDSDSENEDSSKRQAVDRSLLSEDEEDGETTQSKLKKLSQVKHASWRLWLLRLIAIGAALCAFVILLPRVIEALSPSLPFCNSTENSSVNPSAVDYFHAIQPYVDCRQCPVHAVCVNGQVTDCAQSYELRNELCVEREEIQRELGSVSDFLEGIFAKQANEAVCQVSMWDFISGKAMNILEELMTIETISVMEQVESLDVKPALSSFSPDYVFARALEMIMKRLKYVKVMTDERLRLGIELAPLLCRVRFQVLSHAKLILGLVIAIAVAGIGYRKYKLRRTEKEFIDRMVKEVRYFLLERAGSKDSYYPAIHLRDHLFDALNVDQRDRKWLRRAVWPKVAALVVEDSRIRTRNAQIYGHQMLVWEWVSPSTSSRKQHRRS